MNIPKILHQIRPNDEWTLRGSTLDDLTWHSDTSKPTLDEMLAGEEALGLLEYRNQRLPEYPSIGDQLDALWKGGDSAAAMLEKIQAVKAKYPKP